MTPLDTEKTWGATTSRTEGLRLEVEETPVSITGDGHQMAIRVGQHTRAAEIELHKIVSPLQDNSPPELWTTACDFPPTPPLRAEETCRTDPTVEDELPTQTLLKELPVSLLLLISGPDQGSTTRRSKIASQHQVRPGGPNTNSTARSRLPARSRDSQLKLPLLGLI
jgi:hypothetical protein